MIKNFGKWTYSYPTITIRIWCVVIVTLFLSCFKIKQHISTWFSIGYCTELCYKLAKSNRTSSITKKFNLFSFIICSGWCRLVFTVTMQLLMLKWWKTWFKVNSTKFTLKKWEKLRCGNIVVSKLVEWKWNISLKFNFTDRFCWLVVPPSVLRFSFVWLLCLLGVCGERWRLNGSIQPKYQKDKSNVASKWIKAQSKMNRMT